VCYYIDGYGTGEALELITDGCDDHEQDDMSEGLPSDNYDDEPAINQEAS
jgi:hypothetical protein